MLPEIEIPPPPPELASYVGHRHDANPIDNYLGLGNWLSRTLLDSLPADFSLDGERVLDFGCGSGRVLRHLLEHVPGAILEGCDIHEASIEWLGQHLPAPHEVFVIRPEPPVSRPDEHYRLIYAFSVFTHLTDNWSEWLSEMHRLLEPGGVLVATIMNHGLAGEFSEDPWSEDRIGMLVLGPGNPRENGGPMVLHSEWWIRAHWGQAFEILSLTRDTGIDNGRPHGQGMVVMRKRDTSVTPGHLEQTDPDEPRELASLQHALKRTNQECVELNKQHDAYANAYRGEENRREQIETELALLKEQAAQRNGEMDVLREQLRQSERPRNAARAIVTAIVARGRYEVSRRRR